MKKFEKIYKELRKQYTDEEIADSMLIPADLTKDEYNQAQEEMKQFRLNMLAQQTEEERIFSDLMRLKYK